MEQLLIDRIAQASIVGFGKCRRIGPRLSAIVHDHMVFGRIRKLFRHLFFLLKDFLQQGMAATHRVPDRRRGIGQVTGFMPVIETIMGEFQIGYRTLPEIMEPFLTAQLPVIVDAGMQGYVGVPDIMPQIGRIKQDAIPVALAKGLGQQRCLAQHLVRHIPIFL